MYLTICRIRNTVDLPCRLPCQRFPWVRAGRGRDRAGLQPAKAWNPMRTIFCLLFLSKQPTNHTSSCSFRPCGRPPRPTLTRRDSSTTSPSTGLDIIEGHVRSFLALSLVALWANLPCPGRTRRRHPRPALPKLASNDREGKDRP